MARALLVSLVLLSALAVNCTAQSQVYAAEFAAGAIVSLSLWDWAQQFPREAWFPSGGGSYFLANWGVGATVALETPFLATAAVSSVGCLFMLLSGKGPVAFLMSVFGGAISGIGALFGEAIAAWALRLSHGALSLYDLGGGLALAAGVSLGATVGFNLVVSMLGGYR